MMLRGRVLRLIIRMGIRMRGMPMRLKGVEMGPRRSAVVMVALVMVTRMESRLRLMGMKLRFMRLFRKLAN